MKKKVLLIDDTELNLISMKEVFQSRMPHCELFLAQSGEEGIQIAIGEQPDTIILDVVMPGMDGYEVCKILKGNDKTKHIPIIMLKAINVSSENRTKGLELGADAFISKPIELVELQAQVNVMLRIKEAEDKLRDDQVSLEELVRQGEKHLKESENRYRSLLDDVLDTSSIGIFVLDSDFKVAWINNATERYFGLQRDDVIGKDKRRLIQSRIKNLFEEPEIFEQKVFATYSDNSYVESFECHILSGKNRVERWLNHWSQPIYSGNYKGGRIEHYFDITDQKKAEIVLRRYARIVSTSNDMLAFLNKEYVYTVANPAYLNRFGWTLDQLIGCTVAEVFGEDFFRQVIKPNVDRCLAGMEVNYHYWFDFPLAGKMYMDMTYCPYFDLEGNVQGVVVNGRNITERKLIDEKMKKQKYYLDKAQELGRFGTWEFDLNANKLSWTHENYKIFGIHNGAEIDFETILEIVHPDDRCYALSEWEAGIKGKSIDFEHRVLVGDLVKWVREKAETIFNDNGEAISIVGFSHDITDQKQAEAREKQNREKLAQNEKMVTLGTLVSGVGHEINNPNTFIMLNTPVLQKKWDETILPILMDKVRQKGADEKLDTTIKWVPQMLKGIQKGSERIRDIVKDLKNFARQDTSDMNNDIDINDIVRAGVALVNSKIKKSTNNFFMQLADDLPLVKGNYQRFEQVVINVIINACNSLTNKTQKIKVITLFDAETVIVEVIDEGCGIETNNLPKITEPFFTTRRDVGGTGLGLSIGAGIIMDHNGEMKFESIPGKGTKVRIELPIFKLN